MPTVNAMHSWYQSHISQIGHILDKYLVCVNASGSVSEQVLSTRKCMTCKPAIVIGINRALIMQIQIQIEHSCLALFNCRQSDRAQVVTRRSTSSYGSVSAGREKWPFNVLFFLKVEPPCDQTWWDSFVFSILSCFSYVLHAENTLVGPVGPF